MKIVSIIIILAFSIFTFQAKAQEISTNDSIKRALLYQRENYPVSEYRDVYKNFMQDFYGPGHLINDKGAASENVKREIASTQSYDGPDYEPTGYKGNFYRVNLKLVADSVIPYDTFLNAFVESVRAIVPPDPDVWKETWNIIDSQINELGWKLNNEENDKIYIKELLKNGNFVVHHSQGHHNFV